ncbi:MAG: vWA domain-containing protein [Oscillospiraceae bacterium]|nr:vWA domain-containing protein [Oscillospiraceae bacterium]
MNKKVKLIATFAAIAVLMFTGIAVGLNVTKNIGKKSYEISEDKAMKSLEKKVSDIDVTQVKARKEPIQLDSTSLKDELPEIEKYPLSVENTTDTYIEIFSSTEKSGEGNDGWLNDVAEAFNNSGIKINGKEVSVAVRPVASGMGMDYISSGKYVPDLYSPSNELWGEMLKSNGIEINMEQEKLIENVAGVLLSKKKYDELISKYGSIDMKTITEATANSEISMGYTNPFASATGLNFLISTLLNFDAQDPLSDTAIAGFENFQANVPYVAYTTLQMRESAKSGILDGFIMEYQTYVNSADLRSKYVFTPFGVYHNSPVYSIGRLSDDKKQIAKEFLDFCEKDEYQDLAKKYGFDYPDKYVCELPEISGDTLIQAQSLWKENKDGDKPISAVFVADISGSMNGEPLNELKRSLLNGAQYINSDNSIGLVTYSTGVYVNLPIAKFDVNQRSLFAGAVTDLDASGSTATFDAILVALNMLMEDKKANPETKPMLFVLSDGETNFGNKLNDIQDILQALKVPVYTIGYNANISALDQISAINEAASINADSDDVVYQLKNLFNAQM